MLVLLFAKNSRNEIFQRRPKYGMNCGKFKNVEGGRSGESARDSDFRSLGHPSPITAAQQARHYTKISSFTMI